MVRGMGTTDFFRFIPLTIIPLTDTSGAMRRAHWGILAQWTEIVHSTVVRIFLRRYPGKQGSKRVSGVVLSSMFH